MSQHLGISIARDAHELINETNPAPHPTVPWKVLIVDDDSEVHQVTKLALRRYEYQGRKIDYLSAYSAEQGRKLLASEPGIALVFLDVIMESPRAGLELVRYMREELGNSLTRVVLRTGQPDELPELSIMNDYDINDYKTKTELTQPKMITTVTAALRSYRDIEALHQQTIALHDLSNRFRYQAEHDSLTGLINRAAFERHLNAAIDSAQVENRTHALCCIDLDQFRVANDVGGHIAGDELLRQLAEILGQSVRSTDIAARIGGDEFALLLHDCPLANAKAIASLALQQISDHQFSWQGKRIRTSASLGLVPINRSTEGVVGALNAADNLAYIAKEAGGNQLQIYAPNEQELDRRSSELDIANRLADAIEQARLELYFQPITALRGEPRNTHYEVLVRMIEPDGTVVAPGVFLPAAKRFNLILDLDRWVTRTAFEWLAQNPIHVSSLSVCSINLSGVSLTDPHFGNELIELLAQTAVPPEKICFEITETEAISNLTSARAFIEKISSYGCKFALDDFGTGFCSFAYLKNLPVDFVKIDGVFIADLLNSPVDEAMVRSINDIAHVMGKQTVAEFVDSPATLAKLAEMGVDFAQGYFIDKPKPLIGLQDCQVDLTPRDSKPRPALDPGTAATHRARSNWGIPTAVTC